MPGLKSIVHGLARLVAALPGNQEIEGLDCCLAGNKPNRPNLLVVLIIITAFCGMFCSSAVRAVPNTVFDNWILANLFDFS